MEIMEDSACECKLIIFVSVMYAGKYNFNLSILRKFEEMLEVLNHTHTYI